MKVDGHTIGPVSVPTGDTLSLVWMIRLTHFECKGTAQRDVPRFAELGTLT